MNILVCNAGSTSLKFKLYDMPRETVLAECRIERVGDMNGGSVKYSGGKDTSENCVIRDYKSGIDKFLSLLTGNETGVIKSTAEIGAVGYKTVLSKDHYGVHMIDDSVIAGMEAFIAVAPVHNACYIEAIRTFRQILPETPMVGVFETAFHSTLKKEAYIYSVPYEWYEKYGVRRFGYHGASHSYVADCLTERLGKSYRAVSCHLGGSGSICAIRDGKSVDTSFGFSLQTGVLHNNRAGDIDPYIPYFLMKSCNMTADEVYDGLGKRGGLIGISGVSNDLRDVEKAAEAGNDRAQLAIDIYRRDIVKYVCAFAGVLGGIDAVAFTGGIGENSSSVRNYVLDSLAFLGMKRDDAGFVRGDICRISAEDSKIAAFVIPANEELGVARKTFQKIGEAN